MHFAKNCVPTLEFIGLMVLFTPQNGRERFCILNSQRWVTTLTHKRATTNAFIEFQEMKIFRFEVCQKTFFLCQNQYENSYANNGEVESPMCNGKMCNIYAFDVTRDKILDSQSHKHDWMWFDKVIDWMQFNQTTTDITVF